VQAPLTKAILRLLQPLIRILLRNGVPFGTFAELARWVYVDVALRDFAIEGRKISDSRVSVLTGLSRKEVRRLKLLELDEGEDDLVRYNRAARVLTAWGRETRYQDSGGRPLDLPVEGEAPSFTSLVHAFSGDVPVRAILDELLRVGAVEMTASRQLRLLERAYVPRTGEAEKLGILGADVAALIRTIDRNLTRDPSGPLFQRKVAYDNLPSEAVAQFKSLSRKKSQELLEEFDGFLAAHDRDRNNRVQGHERWLAGIGIYYFDEKLEEGCSEPKTRGTST